MDDVYGFSGEDASALLRKLDEGAVARPSQRRAPAGERIETYLGKATSSITALTSTTTILTTLDGAINNSVTSILVHSVASMPTGVQFIITIGTEDILVISISSLTLTVARGANGTTAASHLDAANVSQTIDALGSGTADLCPVTLDEDGNFAVDRTQSFSETVLNASTLISNGTLFLAHREPFSGNLIAVAFGPLSILAHTAATFTIPAVAGTVSVNITSAVDTSIWMLVGQTIEIDDTTHRVYGWISAIADATHFTLTLTRVAIGSVGNTMASNATVIISGDPAGGGSTYTFDVGTAGSDFNVDVSGSPHIIYNLPDANLTKRGAVTTGVQTFAGEKFFYSASHFQTAGDTTNVIVATGAFISGNISKKPFIYFNQTQTEMAAVSAAWSSGTTYAFGDIATGSDGHVYFSKVGSNTNHNPASGGSPTQWSATPVQSLLVLGGGDSLDNTDARYCVITFNSLTGSTLNKGITITDAAGTYVGGIRIA